MLTLILSRNVLASVCEDSPESLNSYMTSILNQVDKSNNDQQLQKNISKPLGCLLKVYRNSSGVTKYLAAACLRPLLGGNEIAEIKKNHRYDVLLKHLVDSALSQDDP